jgi:hypothetical protein
MKNYKLTWGGKNNTKVLKMMAEGSNIGAAGMGQTGPGTGAGNQQPRNEPTTETYVEPTGQTQSYPINQVLVTPGNLTAWGSLTINWINNPIQQQTQEVDSTENWLEQQGEKYNQQSDDDYI